MSTLKPAINVEYSVKATAKMIELGITQEEMQALVDRDIAELVEEGLEDPYELFFHTIFTGDPEKPTTWVLMPHSDDSFLLSPGTEEGLDIFDTVDPAEGSPFAKGGAWHGMKIVMAMPEEDDRPN